MNVIRDRRNTDMLIMKMLRKKLHLSQSEFGASIQLSRNEIANREKNRTPWHITEINAAKVMLPGFLRTIRAMEDRHLLTFFAGKAGTWLSSARAIV